MNTDWALVIMQAFVVLCVAWLVIGIAFAIGLAIKEPASLRSSVLRNVHLTYKPVEAER